MRKVGCVVITFALVAAVGCRSNRIKAEDEGPIIVRNGSLTVDTSDTSAKWTDDGDWSHETTDKMHHGDLWVLVLLKDGSKCPASGQPEQGSPVQIDYSEAGFKAMFKVVGNNPPRTKVSPKNDFRKASDQQIVHDGTGHVTGIKINGHDLSCAGIDTQLDQIKICSSDVKCK